jgi:hypothetical protein
MNIDRKSESDPRPNKSRRLNWEMFAIWSLVALSFAAFFVTGCALWVKCHGK